MAICEEKKIPFMSIREISFAKTTFLNTKFKLIPGYGGKKFNKVNQVYFHMVKNNKQKDIDIELNADQATIKFVVKMLLKVIYTFLFTKYKKYTLGYFIKSNYFEFGENSFLNERFQHLLTLQLFQLTDTLTYITIGCCDFDTASLNTYQFRT
jgi:hypothetical protein